MSIKKASINFQDIATLLYPRLYHVIKQEYENFTTEEYNLPAYSCPTEECGISNINARGEAKAVVKFNPACWDRSLPVTTVRYLSWQYRPESVSDKLEECIYIPDEKEELGNGIDRYGSEKIVIYNPVRPPLLPSCEIPRIGQMAYRILETIP